MRTAAIFDLDGTITKRGTYTPFIIFVARRNPPKFLHAFSIIAAMLLYKLRLLARERLKEIMLKAALGGARRKDVSAYAVAFAKRCIRKGLRPGAVHAIARHRAAGDLLVLATASFEFYAECLGRRLGFDTIVGTKAEWNDDDTLSGRIAGFNCRGPEKLRRISGLLPDLRDRYRVVAYSDNYVDVPLLCWADQAIAVNPNRRLRSLAAREGFQVVDWNESS